MDPALIDERIRTSNVEGKLFLFGLRNVPFDSVRSSSTGQSASGTLQWYALTVLDGEGGVAGESSHITRQERGFVTEEGEDTRSAAGASSHPFKVLRNFLRSAE